MKVSVILPTYNESGNIVDLIREIKKSIPDRYIYEIIVVDDNSPDKTYQIVKNTFKDDPTVILILRTMNRGLPNSIRAGIEKASGDHVLVMDTDFTHDPAEIPKMLHVAQEYDIVSGSRFCPGGNMQDTRHYIASMMYNWLVRIIIRTQVQDNLGGFFTIRKAKLDNLPFDHIFLGYGDYFFRLLHYAQRYDLTIVEIPAQYNIRKQGKSKSNFFKMLFLYTSALVQLKIQCIRDNRLQDS
jgi:dolichol-phosphate mannosyltransferase